MNPTPPDAIDPTASTPPDRPGSAAGTVAEQAAEQADLARLHGRLAASAAERGLLDLAYRTLDSPVGPLLVAASERGLVRVAFATEDFDRVLATLAARVSPRVLESPNRLDAAAAQLDEYFAGRRRAFALPLDFALSSGFRESVQRVLPTIPFGRTETYREVALAVGNPKAVRAVGSACATNPLPIVVPCHRVLRTDGGLGGYLGGLDAKRALLALESAAGLRARPCAPPPRGRRRRSFRRGGRSPRAPRR